MPRRLPVSALEAAGQLAARETAVTVAELELGVHLAGDEHVRAERLRTLHSARETYVALPIDERVTSKFAEVVAAARYTKTRLRVQDAWIAATALTHDAAIITQDRDYSSIADLSVVVV